MGTLESSSRSTNMNAKGPLLWLALCSVLQGMTSLSITRTLEMLNTHHVMTALSSFGHLCKHTIQKVIADVHLV